MEQELFTCHSQAMPSVEKRATMIQLIDGWRSSKQGADPESAKKAKRMSKDECEEVLP
jgi:hypothetical protein